MASRVAPDGGALADYLRRVAGMNADDAARAARAAVERVARGYHGDQFKAAQAVTDAMVAAAGRRQGEDLAAVFEHIGATYASPEAGA